MKPSLKDIKNHGFKVPDNYFNTLEHRLMEQNSKKQEALLPKHTEFKVPDGYFNKFDNNLLDRIKEGESKVISLFPKPVLYYVAGIAAILLLVFTIFNRIDENKTLNFDNIDMALIETYFLENSVSLSDTEMTYLLGDDDIENSNFDDIDIDEQFLIDYLIEELDENNLINELQL